MTSRASRGALGALAGLSLVWAPSAALADEGDARALGSPFGPDAATDDTHEVARTCGEEPDAPEFALDVMADATLPIAVGGRIALEVPGHFVVYVNVGLVPVAFVDGVNDIGTGWGFWTENDAQIARTMVGDATWLEAGLGIRPAGTPGIEITAGYTLLWTHRLTTLDGFSPGTAALVGTSTGGDALGIDVSVNAIHAELAWQTLLFDHVSFRAAIGWVHAFSHDVTIVTDSHDELVTTAIGELSRVLEDELGRRAFGPTLSFGLGVHL
ncbi:MAG: hypothetical protein K1X94_07565 [Sandaracinaceae bacterium]|nr:hypothetical protein [Sandaracinaceae bacterium]